MKSTLSPLTPQFRRRCAELYYLYGTALALEADQLDGDELFGPQVSPPSLL